MKKKKKREKPKKKPKKKKKKLKKNYNNNKKKTFLLRCIPTKQLISITIIIFIFTKLYQIINKPKS